jgi:hypothetical protein
MTMDYWVFDLASLRYRSDPDSGRLSVLTAAGEILASIEVEETTSEREAVFRALDDALSHGRLVRAGGAVPVAFLNPYSNQVAVDAIPDTVTYQSEDTLDLGDMGKPAILRDGLLQIDGQHLVPITPDMGSIIEALTSHRE